MADELTGLTGDTNDQVIRYFARDYPNITDLNLPDQLIVEALDSLTAIMETYNLNGNFLTVWPGNAATYPALTNLDLGGNAITGVEQDFSSTAMALLTYLDIAGGNDFTVTGGALSVDQYSILTYCDISGNDQFTSLTIAAPFSVLAAFAGIDCKFTVWPFTSANVPVIQSIKLPSNLLTGIINVSGYNNLATFDVSSNSLDDVILGTGGVLDLVCIQDCDLTEATVIQVLEDLYNGGAGTPNGYLKADGSNEPVDLLSQSKIDDLESLGWTIDINRSGMSVEYTQCGGTEKIYVDPDIIVVPFPSFVESTFAQCYESPVQSENAINTVALLSDSHTDCAECLLKSIRYTLCGGAANIYVDPLVLSPVYEIVIEVGGLCYELPTETSIAIDTFAINNSFGNCLACNFVSVEYVQCGGGGSIFVDPSVLAPVFEDVIKVGGTCYELPQISATPIDTFAFAASFANCFDCSLVSVEYTECGAANKIFVDPAILAAAPNYEDVIKIGLVCYENPVASATAIDTFAFNDDFANCNDCQNISVEYTLCGGAAKKYVDAAVLSIVYEPVVEIGGLCYESPVDSPVAIDTFAINDDFATCLECNFVSVEYTECGASSNIYVDPSVLSSPTYEAVVEVGGTCYDSPTISATAIDTFSIDDDFADCVTCQTPPPANILFEPCENALCTSGPDCGGDPSIALTVTGTSGTINWCGETWNLPAQSGETRCVCPTTYNKAVASTTTSLPGGFTLHSWRHNTSLLFYRAHRPSASNSYSCVLGVNGDVSEYHHYTSPSITLKTPYAGFPGNPVTVSGKATPANIPDGYFFSYTKAGIEYQWERGLRWA